MPVVHRMKHRDKRRLIIAVAGASVSLLLLLTTLPSTQLSPPSVELTEQAAPKTRKTVPPPVTGHRVERLPKTGRIDGVGSFIEIVPEYHDELDGECGIRPAVIHPHTLVVVPQVTSKYDYPKEGGVVVAHEPFDLVSAVQAYAKGVDEADGIEPPAYVVIRHPCVEVDVKGMLQALADNEVTAATCRLLHEGSVVSDGLEPRIVTGDDVRVYPRLHGFSSRDKRIGGSTDVIVPHPQCAAMRVPDVLEATSQHCIAGNPLCFTSSLWDIHLTLKPVIKVATTAVYPASSLPDYTNTLKLLREKHHDQLVQAVHRSREAVVHRAAPDQSLLGVTLMWDTYCSCTGVNIEVIHYLTAMEKAVNTRAVADSNCWCKGFPNEVVTTLDRLTQPKDLDATLKSVVQEDEQVTVWVSHKPPDRYPDFPYKGVIDWETRPDWVVGRSMIEVDKITPSWVTEIANKVDEVWVPSSFMARAFRSSGVKARITTVPESIDTNLYDPDVTEPYPGIPEGFNFMSNFKWEQRKGWDILLAAFFSLYKKGDGVNLVLKTHLYMEHDPHNPKRIRDKINTFAKKHNFPLDTLPTVHIISEELPAAEMPKIYKAVDCFVLPTRGEGWGLPMHEAMSMGLPTIATNWGGNTHFMTEENSLLIAINSTEKAKGFPGQWAVPSVEDLKTKMQWVRANPNEAGALGAAARKSIVASFSQEAVTPIIVKRLLEIKATVLDKRRSG